MYEFACAACGERFEGLVPAGTESADCPGCGAAGAPRVLSAHSAPAKLALGPGAKRAQERRNADLRRRAKADFATRRRRAGGSGAG
jgi:putative FmdB family regulatory protein